MEIRTVTETEITAAGKIYTACSHAMNQKGLFNWTPEYPTQKEAERDQRAGALYGAFDGKVLMLSLIHILLRDISWSMLMDTLRKVNPIFIPLGFALMVCFVACEAINIRMILRQVGMRVPFFRCLRYSFVGFYFSSITPSASGGQPAQAYYMNKEGIPVSLSSLTLLVIVAIYQLVMMILSLIHI